MQVRRRRKCKPAEEGIDRVKRGQGRRGLAAGINIILILHPLPSLRSVGVQVNGFLFLFIGSLFAYARAHYFTTEAPK